MSVCHLCCQDPFGFVLLPHLAFSCSLPLGVLWHMKAGQPHLHLFSLCTLSCLMRRHQAHLDDVQATDLTSPQKSIPLLSELSNPLTLLADVLYLGCLVN